MIALASEVPIDLKMISISPYIDLHRINIDNATLWMIRFVTDKSTGIIVDFSYVKAMLVA